MSVHNTSPSVAEYLTAHHKPVHFVNRLDQETSGLMVVAKSPTDHTLLSAALATGKKTYRALLRGTWKYDDKTALWNWPISDKAEGRKQPAGIASERKNSLTGVKLLRTNNYFSEIEAEIHTGRQHQIRKHAALAKQPIVGDRRYNDPAYNERMGQLYLNQRLCLHAEKIEFSYKGKDYLFTAPVSFAVFFC